MNFTVQLLPHRSIFVTSINIPDKRIIVHIVMIEQNVAVYGNISVTQLRFKPVRSGFYHPEVFSL